MRKTECGHSDVQQLREQKNQANDDALRQGETEERGRRDASHTMFFAREMSAQDREARTEFEVQTEASSLTQLSRLVPKPVDPNSSEVELEAAAEETHLAKSSWKAHAADIRARNLTGVEAFAEEASIAADAVRSSDARSRAENKLIMKEAMNEAALLKAMKRERREAREELKEALRCDGRRMFSDYQELERVRYHMMQQDQQCVLFVCSLHMCIHFAEWCAFSVYKVQVF